MNTTKTLTDYLTIARTEKRAIPHFNVSTIDMLHAVVDALDEVSEESGMEIPMVIGFAEKERDWIGATSGLDNRPFHLFQPVWPANSPRNTPILYANG